MQTLVEGISLWGTFHTVGLALLVLKLWGKQALRILKTGPENSNDWFIIGVFFGFIGQVLDNSYWFVPWSLAYIEHPTTSVWIKSGVWFNIIFRQTMGSLAAYCHVKSYVVHADTGMSLAKFLIYTSLVATIYIIVLSLL